MISAQPVLQNFDTMQCSRAPAWVGFSKQSFSWKLNLEKNFLQLQNPDGWAMISVQVGLVLINKQAGFVFSSFTLLYFIVSYKDVK